MMKGQTAIALSYTATLTAPLIIARGKDNLAEKMLAIAQECGIRVVSDSALADILSDAEIGTCIPVETYEAVASIFAFLEKGIKEEWFIKS